MKPGILTPLILGALVGITSATGLAEVYAYAETGCKTKYIGKFEFKGGGCQELPSGTKSFIVVVRQPTTIDRFATLNDCENSPLYPDKSSHQTQRDDTCYGREETRDDGDTFIVHAIRQA